MPSKARVNFLVTEVQAGNLFLGYALNEGNDLEEDSVKVVLERAIAATLELENMSLRDFHNLDDRNVCTSAFNATFERRKLLRLLNRRQAPKPMGVKT